MGWVTYADGLRLNGETWFYLLRVDNELSVEHPLPGGVTGAAALHPTEAGARRAAQALGEPLADTIARAIDLDALRSWCQAPSAETIDHDLCMVSWHALADLGVCEIPPVAIDPREPGFALSTVADKVHLGSNVADLPILERPPTPTWSSDELALLARTLGQAVERLVSDVVRRLSQMPPVV